MTNISPTTKSVDYSQNIIFHINRHFWSINSHIKSQLPSDLAENYDLQVLIGPSSGLLPVSSNRGSNKGRISLCQCTSKKSKFSSVFAQKLRVSKVLVSPLSLLLPLTQNKGSSKGSSKGSFCVIYSRKQSISMYFYQNIAIF